MGFRTRALARIGAAALLVAGALATVQAPAQANGEQADLELTVAGLKLAAEPPLKLGWAKITNHGPGVPTALSITADLSALDDRGGAVPFGETCVPDEADLRITCDLPGEMVPGVGETVEVPVFVIKAEDADLPHQAPVIFTVNSPDDPEAGNNTRTVQLTFSDESGVDLAVLVPDVKHRLEDVPENPLDGEPTGTPLKPGDTTYLYGVMFNWGDMAAAGIKVTVRLPQQVTFAEPERDCVYEAENRKAVCTYETVVLGPTLLEPGESIPFIWFPVTVGAGVTTPVLHDGSVTIEALRQTPADTAPTGTAGRSLPKNIGMFSADAVDAHEVDASDNTDGFAVIVEAASGGGGGGGGDEGHLPVTGVQAGLIAGVGLAVLIAGAALLLLSRRRRVVLVTPEDEKPAV